MVGYAPREGNVGAHIDNYDVFLLQGQGKRRWEWGEEPVHDEEIVPDLDVRMLKDFVADREAVLEPGDMLYLPPRIAHHGVSMGDGCMTYSVGFRAPSHEELIADFMQYAMERTDPDARYGDPNLSVPDEPGEIGDEARESIRCLLRSLTADDASIDRWFGSFITEPKRDRFAMPLPEDLSEADIREAIRSGQGVRRGPATRLAFIRHEDGTASLFVNGSEILLGDEIAYAAPLLTGAEFIPDDDLRPHLDDDAFTSLLKHLVNDGLLELSPSLA
jgi:50S ribosomal protein L16 3-hydroxylase